MDGPHLESESAWRRALRGAGARGRGATSGEERRAAWPHTRLPAGGVWGRPWGWLGLACTCCLAPRQCLSRPSSGEGQPWACAPGRPAPGGVGGAPISWPPPPETQSLRRISRRGACAGRPPPRASPAKRASVVGDRRFLYAGRVRDEAPAPSGRPPRRERGHRRPSRPDKKNRPRSTCGMEGQARPRGHRPHLPVPPLGTTRSGCPVPL